MAYGTYQGIVNAIADNVGERDQSSLWLRIVKDDIFTEMCKIYRKVKPIKVPFEDTLKSTFQELAMPDDFFLPLEVIFFDTDGNRYPCKELQNEEFIRWNPNVTLATTSFNDIITDASPQPLYYTQENVDFDGLIGYSFFDTNPITLKWKPSINGSYQMLYSTYPEVISSLTNSPDVHTVFQDLIVLGVTIQHLIRRLSGVKDQNEFMGTQAALNRYSDDYKETMNDFNGYVNSNISTPIISPFDFLNSPDMLILKR